jgi:hypothetical protein
MEKPVKIRLGNACRGRWRAPHRALMVVAPPQYIRATPVITRVHQIDQPLAGRLLNGSLSGQFSRSGEARGSADVGGSPLSMFDGSIDSPRATRADCRSGLISRLPLLLIYDSLFRHTHIVRKLTFLGVQKCGCVGIGYFGDRNIRARSLKNGSILYEDFELRNEVTVTFPIEGIFQNSFNF